MHFRFVRYAACFAAAGLALLLSWTAGSAQQLQVPVGCSAPVSTSNHSTYYVDPVQGSMAGDGSKSHPWLTLAAVFDVRNRLIANAPATYIAGIGIIQPNPNAPIKSGDTIYLMTGNHGAPMLQGYFGSGTTLNGYNNTSFITVAAAPGQTPVVSQLTLLGVGKWLFQGITFQSLQNVPSNNGQPFTNSNNTSDYNLVGMGGPTSDVIFDHDKFLSQADVSSWTVNDFLSKRVSGFTATGGSCHTLTNNTFTNIGFAIGTQKVQNVLIRHNVIDTFTDDGIDYGSNNTVIDGNVIMNCINDGDGFHDDGMQGQPFDATTPIVNTTITNNVVINQAKPLVGTSDLQGIDAFDGIWQNVLVANNVVVTNDYHGITFYGANHISIVNNTVIGTATQIGQGISTWIDVSPSKTGQPSTAVTVRNNIAATFQIVAASAFIDHNVLATMNTNLIQYFHPSAAIAAAVTTTSVLTAFNPSTFSYDPRLLNSTAVVGAGSVSLAPRLDIRGYVRGKRVDLGALKYGGIPIGVLQ